MVEAWLLKRAGISNVVKNVWHHTLAKSAVRRSCFLILPTYLVGTGGLGLASLPTEYM